MAERSLLARDIMTRDVITVGPDDDVEKAARLLLEHHISGLPVVDEAGKLVGIVSEADLVLQEKGVRGPRYTVFMGGVLYLENPRRFEEEFKRAVARRIGDLMSKKVYTAAPDDPVAKVAAIMADRRVNRVPVVDAEQKVVGIISRQDVIRASYGA